jgi:hypothetical protein
MTDDLTETTDMTDNDDTTTDETVTNPVDLLPVGDTDVLADVEDSDEIADPTSELQGQPDDESDPAADDTDAVSDPAADDRPGRGTSCTPSPATRRRSSQPRGPHPVDEHGGPHLRGRHPHGGRRRVQERQEGRRPEEDVPRLPAGALPASTTTRGT